MLRRVRRVRIAGSRKSQRYNSNSIFQSRWSWGRVDDYQVIPKYYTRYENKWFRRKTQPEDADVPMTAAAALKDISEKMKCINGCCMATKFGGRTTGSPTSTGRSMSARYGQTSSQSSSSSFAGTDTFVLILLKLNLMLPTWLLMHDWWFSTIQIKQQFVIWMSESWKFEIWKFENLNFEL